MISGGQIDSAYGDVLGFGPCDKYELDKSMADLIKLQLIYRQIFLSLILSNL